MHYTMLFIAGFLLSLFHLIIYMGVEHQLVFERESFVGCNFYPFRMCLLSEIPVKVTKPLRHRKIRLRWRQRP